MMSVRGWMTAIAAAMILAAQTTSAQCVLPAGISDSSGPLSASQQRQVDSYVECWIDQMINAEDRADIAIAQKKLVVEMTVGSEAFKPVLSRSISSQLNKPMQSDNAAVRINAAIVTSALIDPGAAQLAIMGLDDENPAVRYWSARAITTMAGKLPAEQQQNLFNALAKAFSAEKSANVQQQMLTSVIELKIPAAFNLAVKALADRANYHYNNPDTSLRADVYIINKINRDLVRGQKNEQAIRQMMGVSCRYLEVGVHRMSNLGGDVQLTEEMRKNIGNVDGYLRWAAEQLKPGAKLPVAIVTASADELTLIVAEWKSLLTGKPFNYKAADLDLVPAQ